MPDQALQNAITGSEAPPDVPIMQVIGGAAKGTCLKTDLGANLMVPDLAAAPYVLSFTSNASVSDGRAAKGT
jgi:hypothetical protein